jgi:hypothetical protein
MNVPLLFKLWHDAELMIPDIAARMGVTVSEVKSAGKRYGLRSRKRIREDAIDNVDDAEEEASCSSLAIAPRLVERAAQVRDRWSETDRRHRTVQRCEPITYQR